MFRKKEFIIENGVLIKYNGKGGNVTIPDEVTSIGRRAFEGCKKLKSIIIPDSVQSVGDSAFFECKMLVDVSLSKNITSIEDHMFQYCTSLTDIVIPNGVKSIGSYAFTQCGNLSSITIPASVTNISKYAFFGDAATFCCPTIHAPVGSFAQQYADENGLAFVADNIIPFVTDQS